MAESLEKRVRLLQAKLADLKEYFSDCKRPVLVDFEIKVLEEQLKSLTGQEGSPHDMTH